MAALMPQLFLVSYSQSGRGCCAIGRAVASNIRDPWFASQHWQSFSNAFICQFATLVAIYRNTLKSLACSLVYYYHGKLELTNSHLRLKTMN